jgi:hypothetical protein
MNAGSRSQLVQLLIAKSAIEIVLVAGLAVGFFLITFPHFQGWGEATPRAIEGWVVSQQHPDQKVEVQLFIDDRFISSGVADRSRPDIVIAGKAKDEWHGFSFEIPALNQGYHVARAYAVHSTHQGTRKTLQLIGDPIPFDLDAEGKARWLRTKSSKTDSGS